MNYLSILALLISTASFADTSVYVKYGVGVFGSARYSYAEVKEVFVGVQDSHGFFIQNFEGGGWVDGRQGDGRKGSMYFNYSLGLQVTPGPLFVNSTIGMGLITTTDSYLGGQFQFNEENCLGLKDDKGVSWGVCYKHISSAGIYENNVGRDLAMFRVSFPIGGN